NGGFVLVDTATGLGAPGAGTITVNDLGQIQLRNGITVVKPTLNLNSSAIGGGLGAHGGTTHTFPGSVVLNSTAGANINASLGAGVGAGNTATRLIINGVISSAGGTQTLFINGSGTVEFVGNNTYTGTTSLNGLQGPGTLQIDSPAG